MGYTFERFGLLFSVKIKHPFFKDDICPYLVLEPDGPTRSFFMNKHMISKIYPAEIKIITPVAAQKENEKVQAKETKTESRHYTFLLKVTDTAFFSVTNLDFTGFPKQVFYFSNTRKNPKLSIKKCFTTDRSISIKFDEGKIPSKIAILNQDSVEIYNVDINKTDRVFVYDMSACENGLYNMVLTFAKGAQQKPQTQVFYYSSLMRREPVIGVIDIDPSVLNNIEDDKNNYIIQLETAK